MYLILLMVDKKTIVKGTFWNLFGQIFVKGFSFIYLVIIAQLLPQETIGEFYVAISIFGILMLFSDLGLNGALVRYVPYFASLNDNFKLIPAAR